MRITNEQMTVGGRTRNYVLVVPTNYDATRTYPLVMSFHGQPGNATGMQKAYPFEGASQSDAIVVYPDGTNSEWELYTLADQNADEPFVKALVDELAGKYQIDRRRVFGTGYSNGGFFINQMACRYHGFFKAIASNAGGAPEEPQNTSIPKDDSGVLQCPGGPIAALVLHGDQDDTVGVASGDWDATFWGHLNGCAATRSATTPSPCQKVDGCPAAMPVEWCLIPGMGHVVWTNGAKVAWDFFRALP